MELVNTHTHTALSGHGEGSVAEVVDAAARAGLSVVALTEHYPLSPAIDPDNTCSMPAERVSSYLAEVHDAAAAHPEMSVLAGCELDYLGAQEDRTLACENFAGFSLVLGSVHFIDGWAFDNPAERAQWDAEGVIDHVWRRYFELWCELASAPGPVTVMAHPDLAKKFGLYPSFDLAPLYEQAAEACASSGRMVEVNTSGLRYPCAEMFPAPALLAAFRRAGVACTVGTDAHAPSAVARGIEDAYRLMRQAGYDCVTVPTSDGDRRRIAFS